LRIAFDGRFLSARYPGIGRYAYNLLRALPAAAPEAEIGVFLGEEDERFPWSRLEGVGRWPLAVPVRGLREQLALPRQLRRRGADVFHSPYFATAWRTPCPLVVTVHDAIGARREYLPPPLARLAFVVSTRLALRAARAVITVSEASRRDLTRRFGTPPEKIAVIPEAAAPELRPPSRESVAELRARRGLPERYALFVGADRPHKNLAGLLRAWAELGAGAWPLVVAGRRDPRFPEARQTARRLGLDARFLGEVPEDDLAALYGGAGLFVLPSLAEGFGLPVLEAMACGTPVACAAAASLPEVAGEAAAYFDPRSTASMVGTLARVLADAPYRRELAEKGLARAKEFSWTRTAELTWEVYRRLKAPAGR
jgi:alpha-1,3-rhamnosyl/mannosyltransferase